jgi:putative RNA 2'-phosphotransferase
MATDPLVRRSKHLSKVLRHDPDSVGIKLDAAGWTSVAGLLPAMKLTMAELEEVVEDNNKKRFEFNADKTMIRASQGHSVDVDLGYEKKTPPDVLYHGSSATFEAEIMIKGLLKMSRHHVHLSADTATALTVARRRPSPIIFDVLAKEMLAEGHEFFLSTNGVWLTEHVPPKFLRKRTT